MVDVIFHSHPLMDSLPHVHKEGNNHSEVILDSGHQWGWQLFLHTFPHLWPFWRETFSSPPSFPPIPEDLLPESVKIL